MEMPLDLTANEQFPESVGLVKKAVLKVLALPLEQESRNPFASPVLLHILGGVLFRSNSPDKFFSKHRIRLADVDYNVRRRR